MQVRLFTAIILLGLTTTSACNKSEPLSPLATTGPPAFIISQVQGISATIGGDSSDSILCLGRLDRLNAVIYTQGGAAYSFALDSGGTSKLPSLISAKGNNTKLFTASAKYVWEFTPSSSTVGRNSNAATDGSHIDIGKITIDDFVSDVSGLAPIAASEDQLYLVARDSLVVFTWSGNTILRKKLAWGTPGLAADEAVLGAGTLDLTTKDQTFWAATNKRLWTFNGTSWSTQPLQFSGPTPLFVTLFFEGNSPTPTGPMIGAFTSTTVSSMTLASGNGHGTSSAALHSQTEGP